MEVIFDAFETDYTIRKKKYIVRDIIGKLLYAFFIDKTYGECVEEFIINCILIRTKPGYEEWDKVRKPKYIEYKVIKNITRGGESIISKSFGMDIKIDFEDYDFLLTSDEESGKKLVASHLLKGLKGLDKLPKKMKDFEKDRFIQDVEQFLIDSKLIDETTNVMNSKTT